MRRGKMVGGAGGLLPIRIITSGMYSPRLRWSGASSCVTDGLNEWYILFDDGGAWLAVGRFGQYAVTLDTGLADDARPSGQRSCRAGGMPGMVSLFTASRSAHRALHRR